MGGYLTIGAGWRWMWWFLFIFGGAVWVFTSVLLVETCVILSQFCEPTVAHIRSLVQLRSDPAQVARTEAAQGDWRLEHPNRAGAPSSSDWRHRSRNTLAPPRHAHHRGHHDLHVRLSVPCLRPPLRVRFSGPFLRSPRTDGSFSAFSFFFAYPVRPFCCQRSTDPVLTLSLHADCLWRPRL